MIKARSLSLFIALIVWATIAGGVMYSHVVFFPPYLSHLPESSTLVTGDYALHDEHFWLFIHPLAILSTITTLFLNWKLKERRTYIFIGLTIYALAILATATYFVPELMAFAGSNNSHSSRTAEWFTRGQTWQRLSWVRGFFVYVAFTMLLIALTKDKNASPTSS